MIRLFFLSLFCGAISLYAINPSEDPIVPVIIDLKDPYPTEKLPNNPGEVAKVLEAHTHNSIQKILPSLAQMPIQEIRPIWITNSVRILTTKRSLSRLSRNWGAIEKMEIETPKQISELEDVGNSSLPSKNKWGKANGWGLEKIHAPEVWEQGIEGKGIVVAVIDSGAPASHPDLAPNLWINTKEIPGNQIDDDNNGYVDDINGWSFDNNSSDLSDINGHGSQAAGLVAGAGTQGTQTGVAPKAKIMILKACCSLVGGTGETAIFEAMQYAIKEGANVISMSLSMKHFSNPSYSKWRQASEILLKSGMIHVNSAGNLGKGLEPQNIGAPGSNPPPWFHPSQVKGDNPTSTITVGATDPNDGIRNYSSIGPVTWETIPEYKDFPYENGTKPGLLKPEICAPSEVPSLSKDGFNYTSSFGGTSSSTPQVAGVMALLLSYNPKLTPAQLTEAVQMSAIPVGNTSYNNHCGAGRIDAASALQFIRKNFK